MSTDILDTPQAQFALALYGADDPEAFLVGLIHVIDELWPEIDRYLTDHGLTLDQFLDMVSTFRNREPEAQLNRSATAKVGDRIASAEGRSIVRNLFLRAFTAEEIAGFLDIDVEVVERYVTGKRRRPDTSAILAHHNRGLSPMQISYELGIPHPTIYRALHNMGLTPNRCYVKLSDALRFQIIALRQQGASYGRIKAETGATLDQVKNALRKAAKDGLLDDYGKKPLR